MHKAPVKINAGFYVSLAVGILILPLKWLIAWLISAAIHEFFHYIAIRLVGSRVLSLHIGFGGAAMMTDSIDGWKHIFCALAGPAGSILLIFFSSIAPRLALCGTIQAVFNLLPIGSLDGAQALRCFLTKMFGLQRGNRVAMLISKTILIILTIFTFLISWRLNIGIWPFLVIVAFCGVKLMKEKDLAIGLLKRYNKTN